MSEAKKLPSGRWRNRLYVGKDATGKRIYESFTADTKKEADALAAVRAREIELGAKKSAAPGMLTVAEAIDSYISTNEAVLAPKTIREYKGYRERYFQGIMRTRIRDLSSVAAQTEINRQAKRYSPKTVRNAWGLVSAAIRAACPEFRVDINLPALIKSEMTIPSTEQLLGLLDDLKGHRLEIPVLIAATCGLRRGEIAALKFPDDVDRQRCVLRVRRSMSVDSDGDWIVRGQTKTYDSTRDVDCPSWLCDILLSLPPDYKPVHPAYMTSGFHRACLKRGIDIRFHDLRHYYASLLISANAPELYITRRMGHKTPNMVRKVYGHLMADRTAEINAAIDAKLEPMHHKMHHDEDDDPVNP